MRWLRAFACAARRGLIWALVLVLELVASVVLLVSAKTLVATHSGGPAFGDVRVAGAPAVQPRLVFACELDTDPLQTLLSNASVVSDLREINAGISLSLIDLSRGRAQVVQQMNRAGIPVTAWLALPKEQGYYLNASNAREAVARFADFEKWTAQYRLQWAGVGLDIEPNLQEFEAARRGNKWQVAATLIWRCFDPGRVSRARDAYAAFIRDIQAHGYPVETYQFPFIADERKVHSTLL
jgi:hypothetical protein